MRRIYESDALDRDDDDPFRPNRSDARVEPRSARTVPAAWLSDRLLPAWARRQAISVSVTTPKSVFAEGEPVPFTVTMKNALPVPVTVRTGSRVPWTWRVDGHPEASRVAEDSSAGPGKLAFDRGERKRFARTWHQAFRVSESEWVGADAGEYTISAAVDDAGRARGSGEPDERESRDGAGSGGGSLGDRTTIRIE